MALMILIDVTTSNQSCNINLCRDIIAMLLAVSLLVLKVVKEEKSREKQTEKDAKKKSKQKKKKTIPEKNGSSNEGPKENEIQTRRIEVQPANPDEDFWDFYEKPFAQS